MLVEIVLTVVSFFWCIYLIDGISRKSACYKSNLRNQQGQIDFHSQSLVYNAKTELVKYGFLLCINTVEWVGFTFATILSIMNTVNVIYYYNQKLSNHTTTTNTTHLALSLEYIPLLDNICLELSATLVGCLCMYLAERHAQKRWINSNSIPHCICFFLLCSIVTQILVIVHPTHIFGIWLDKLLILLSLIFAWKQYRKLNMVITWSIVDLQVRGSKHYLAKQIRTKRNFNIAFMLIRMGVLCIFTSEILEALLLTIRRISPKERMYIHSILEDSDFTHRYYLLKTVTISKLIISTTGCFILLFPYMIYGLVTMFVILWRLCNGKTGFQTRFRNELTTPLVDAKQ